jgi:hypothetical protein
MLQRSNAYKLFREQLYPRRHKFGGINTTIVSRLSAGSLQVTLQHLLLLRSSYSRVSIRSNILFALPSADHVCALSFENLYFSDLQSCLCTTSGTFAPNYYDGYFSSCLSFVSKYDPQEYSQLGPIGGGKFSGTFSGVAISHGLGSSPCHAYYEYTQTTTPASVSSQPPVPPPETSTSSQGVQALALGGHVKVKLEFLW